MLSYGLIDQYTTFEKLAMARQNFVGLVVSQGKMNKTVKVRVQTPTYDSRIHKEIMKRKDYLVHDEGNLCKEGDIVRIESIPKMSPRKYFAIAEIKINKGQQFAEYEALAKKQVSQEQKDKIQEFLSRKSELEGIIQQVEDLKALDRLSKKFEANPDADRDFVLGEVQRIKEKYGITAWPSTEPVVKLELNEAAKDLSVFENRMSNIQHILAKLMSSEYAEQRTAILQSIKNGEDAKPNIQKNLLRKWVLDPKNELPLTL